MKKRAGEGRYAISRGVSSTGHTCFEHVHPEPNGTKWSSVSMRVRRLAEGKTQELQIELTFNRFAGHRTASHDITMILSAMQIEELMKAIVVDSRMRLPTNKGEKK